MSIILKKDTVPLTQTISLNYTWKVHCLLSLRINAALSLSGNSSVTSGKRVRSSSSLSLSRNIQLSQTCLSYTDICSGKASNHSPKSLRRRCVGWVGGGRIHRLRTYTKFTATLKVHCSKVSRHVWSQPPLGFLLRVYLWLYGKTAWLVETAKKYEKHNYISLDFLNLHDVSAHVNYHVFVLQIKRQVWSWLKIFLERL